MRVEMKVFSGRPNPKWQLESDDEFKDSLRKLPRHDGILNIPEGLGYCGTVVCDQDIEVIVYHEIVVVKSKNRVDYLIDDEETLENLLLKSAENHVSEQVIERIRGGQFF